MLSEIPFPLAGEHREGLKDALAPNSTGTAPPKLGGAASSAGADRGGRACSPVRAGMSMSHGDAVFH
jgi:hypothetical protein